MAVGTSRRSIVNRIRPSVCHRTDVVDLKVRQPLGRLKWRVRVADFASPCRFRQDPCDNVRIANEPHRGGFPAGRRPGSSRNRKLADFPCSGGDTGFKSDRIIRHRFEQFLPLPKPVDQIDEDDLRSTNVPTRQIAVDGLHPQFVENSGDVLHPKLVGTLVAKRQLRERTLTQVRLIGLSPDRLIRQEFAIREHTNPKLGFGPPRLRSLDQIDLLNSELPDAVNIDLLSCAQSKRDDRAFQPRMSRRSVEADGMGAGLATQIENIRVRAPAVRFLT